MYLFYSILDEPIYFEYYTTLIFTLYSKTFGSLFELNIIPVSKIPHIGNLSFLIPNS